MYLRSPETPHPDAGGRGDPHLSRPLGVAKASEVAFSVFREAAAFEALLGFIVTLGMKGETGYDTRRDGL